MKFVKKILLVHGDAKTRRTLTLLLAGAGYDVRAVGCADAALEASRSEWFDLSVVTDPLPEMGSFDLVAALKKLQPSVAVFLLVNQLDLPSVIKGIRLAVTDVLAPEGDWGAVLQRINAFLRPGETLGPEELSPKELAEVEVILARLDDDSSRQPALAAGQDPMDAWREEAGRLTRERDNFKMAAERLAQEKTALEAELKARLARHGDLARLKDELVELRGEREIVAAAQAAVDEKARTLALAREQLAQERAAYAEERVQGLSTDDARRLKTAEELAHERELLNDWRLDLRAENVRLHEQAAQIEQGQARIAAERQLLQEDVNLLREQEANLRAYEQSLRALTAQAEADRVLRAAQPRSREPFERNSRLDDAWKKLDRALDLLQAERRNFNDQKLVLREEKKRLEEKLTALEARETELCDRELRLNSVPTRGPRPSFAEQPFKAARAMFADTLK